MTQRIHICKYYFRYVCIDSDVSHQINPEIRLDLSVPEPSELSS